jgi:hypothetical protein
MCNKTKRRFTWGTRDLEKHKSRPRHTHTHTNKCTKLNYEGWAIIHFLLQRGKRNQKKNRIKREEDEEEGESERQTHIKYVAMPNQTTKQSYAIHTQHARTHARFIEAIMRVVSVSSVGLWPGPGRMILGSNAVGSTYQATDPVYPAPASASCTRPVHGLRGRTTTTTMTMMKMTVRGHGQTRMYMRGVGFL